MYDWTVDVTVASTTLALPTLSTTVTTAATYHGVALQDQYSYVKVPIPPVLSKKIIYAVLDSVSV